MMKLILMLGFAFAACVSAQADSSDCALNEQLHSCFSLSAQQDLSPQFPKRICFTSLCLKTDANNPKAAPVIVLDGDTFASTYTAKVEQAHDYDGDTIYGKLNYEVTLADDVKFTNKHRVQCPTDASPKCWWFEYDTYSSTSLWLRMSAYNGKMVSLDLAGMFYGTNKKSPNNPVVVPVQYKIEK